MDMSTVFDVKQQLAALQAFYGADDGLAIFKLVHEFNDRRQALTQRSNKGTLAE